MNPPTYSQTEAVRARGNVLVVAGAGTGKTRTLVERCLALVCNGASLENMLLVTYTISAAAEMRQRIREALRQKLGGVHQQPEREAPHRLAEHLERQLALLDTARISTLHSFCLELVRTHFYQLGIDPEVSVLDEQQTQPLIERTLDALFERAYAGEDPPSTAAQELVRMHGRGSDAPIRALVVKVHRYAQSLANPDAWFDEQRRHLAKAEPAQWRVWLRDGFDEWRSLWLPILEEFGGTPAIELCVATLRNVRDKPSVTEIAGAVQTIKNADDDGGNWPRGSIKKVRDRLKQFFAEAEFLWSLMPAEQSNPLAEDWEEVRHPMAALLWLTREFSVEFTRAKRELGGVDFADLEQLALQLLRDPAAGVPSAVAREWRDRLHHVFVDEYQDITAAQDAILTALSRDGDSANRFLVGDVKQSIYRFRLADPTIFTGYEQRWRDGSGEGRRVALTDNFRSREAILNFVNPLFAALMRPMVGGVTYEALSFGDAKNRQALARDGDAGKPCVELHLITKAEPANDHENGEETDDARADLLELDAIEREARLVALRLRELGDQKHQVWDKEEKRFRDVQWKDMGVLLRSPKGRVEAFAKAFHQADVPLHAERAGFLDALEVTDLLNLLRLLDNPLQDVPLLAVLRSPLVGLSLDELARVRRPPDRHGLFWFALRHFRETGKATGGDTELWSRVNGFLDQLAAWRELMRHSSLSQCLETALAETHYEALLLAGERGAARGANVRRLVDMARRFDPYQREGLFRFLRFIDEQQEAEVRHEPAAAATENAVRLMTIHQSKGLEFSVVVVAGLGVPFNFQDLKQDILLDERYGVCPKVAPPDGCRRYPSLAHWLARRRQKREALGEELRLLYVAMTRARDTLILTATASGKGDPKWSSAESRSLSAQEILAARSYFAWLRLWLPQVTPDADWAGERDGQSALLRWTIHSEDDPRLALPADPDQRNSIKAVEVPDASALKKLRERVSWRYPFAAAIEARAKTTVTELRRRRVEEDDEAQTAPFARRSAFAVSTKRDGPLTAAEVGTAHHRFLEFACLKRLDSLADVQAEAERLVGEGRLTSEEVKALKLTELMAFWRSELGNRIRSQDERAVRRELPFTARFSPSELAAAGLDVKPGLSADEFIVVQGVADLAVILTNKIWLVDFKTDAVSEIELDAKVNDYGRQLRLYAAALERVFKRPVSESWLHFFSLRKSVLV